MRIPVVLLVTALCPALWAQNAGMMAAQQAQQAAQQASQAAQQANQDAMRQAQQANEDAARASQQASQNTHNWPLTVRRRPSPSFLSRAERLPSRSP